MTSRRATRRFAEWSAFFFSASGGKKENPAIGGDPHGLVLATGQQAYHDRVSGKKHGEFHAAAEAGKRKRHTQRACLLTSHTAFAAQYKNTPGVTRWEHKETYALLGRCGLLILSLLHIYLVQTLEEGALAGAVVAKNSEKRAALGSKGDIT